LSRPKGAPAKKPVQKFTLLPESSRAGGASAKRLLPRATLLRPASDDDLDVAGADAEPKSPRSSSRLSRSADTDSRSRSRSRSRSSPYAKERPAAAIFPEVDELGIEILIPEYDRVTVAVAWHVSKATAAALAPRADALVAAMLAPTVQAYARVPEKRRVDFVSIPVTWTAAAAASDTPYHDTLRSYERGSAPSMLKLMRQAWKKVPFCFAGHHVHNCMIVITDGHEDVLREPCEEMAMLMRGMATHNIDLVFVDILSGAGAGAESLARMKALFGGSETALFDVVRASVAAEDAGGFKGFSFAHYSMMWIKRAAARG
jgi:hypothetical protein